MTNKDYAIGILSVTAVILLVGVLLLNVGPVPRAYAYGQCSTGGDYLVATSQLDEMAELLYVLDAASEQMNVYAFNVAVGRVELIRSLDVRWRPPVVPPAGRPGNRGK